MTTAAISTPITQRLLGKVALITGGASGIGECTARLFVKHGAKVILADIQDQLGRAVCQEIGPEDVIFYVHCDVTCEADVQYAVHTAVSKHGKLDVMFSNAGIVGELQSSKISLSDNTNFKKVLEVNTCGGFLAAKHAARVMIPAKTGCIIFTASVVSVVVSGASSHSYVASKHAVVGLTKNLCVELGQHGIRVNCISPYTVPTPMVTQATGMEKGKIQEIMSSVANLKGVTLGAEDVAHAALYLGSDEAKYVSGINLVIDGGYSVTNSSSFGLAFKNLCSSSTD